MNKKIFIGFSQINGLPIANQVKREIENACSWIKCEFWSDENVFSLNRDTLNSLIISSKKYEYGIFIATKDDIANKSGSDVYISSDNVIFEIGLFLGSMGIERSFIMIENGCKLPSDFNGITVPIFERDDESSISGSINKIINQLNNNRKAYGLRPIPSAVLALGYFDNFLEPFARFREKTTTSQNDQVKVVLPANINAIVDKNKFYELIEQYEKIYESDNISVYNDQKRPVIKKIKNKKNLFWDIPTTLHTLKKLFDRVYPEKNIIGSDVDSDKWIQYEVNSFADALDTLIKGDISFIDLNVSFIWLEYKDGVLKETLIQSNN